LSENSFSALFIYGKIYQTLILLFRQLISILFFNCTVEEDGAVASAGISGQDEGFWTNQRQWIRQNVLKC